MALDDWIAEFLEAIQEKLKLCGLEVIRDDLRLHKVTLFLF